MKRAAEHPPTEEELAILYSLLYDTLLGSQPLIASNVRERLTDLLVALRRPKLAEALAGL